MAKPAAFHGNIDIMGTQLGQLNLSARKIGFGGGGNHGFNARHGGGPFSGEW
jgi:predicted oxidoreductase